MKSILLVIIPILFYLTNLSAQCTGKIDISAASGYSATIINDLKGNVFGFGNNISGQIGNDTKDNIYIIPTQPFLPTNIKVKQVAKGTNTSIVLTCDKTVYTFGSNSKGQAGVDVSDNSAIIPRQVVGGFSGKAFLENVKFVDADGENGYAILESGEVMAWGAGADGNLGNNSVTEISKPVYVLKADGNKLQNVINISGSAAVTKDGVIWTWGSNQNRRAVKDLVAVKLTQENGSELPAIVQITKGTGFYLALDKIGNVWSWGDLDMPVGNNFGRNNQFGQLGRSQSNSYNFPYKVEGGITNSTFLGNVVHIAAGEYYSLAALKSGEVVGWGSNKYYSDGTFGGQLAKGNIDDSPKPNYLKTNANTNIKNISRVYAGSAWTLAVSKDDKIFIAGYNQEGQLGLGDKRSRLYAEELILPLGKNDSEIQDITITDAKNCGGNGNVEFKIKQLKKNVFEIDINGDGIYDLKELSEKGSKYSVDLPIGTVIKNVVLKDQDGNISVAYTAKSGTIGGPVSPNFTVKLNDPTTCRGSNGFATLSNLVANTKYTITAKFNNIQLSNEGFSSDNQGILKFENLSDGTYTDLNVKLASGLGCEKIEKGPFKISDPAAPTFSVNASDPTCDNPNAGSINFSDLKQNTSYLISYFKNNVAVNNATFTTDNDKKVSITGLGNGKYEKIKVTLTECQTTSPSVFTLAAPAAPNVVVTPPTIICGATTTNLTAAAVTAGSDAGLTFDYYTNSNGTAVVNTPTAVTAGTYYIKGSNANCTSALKSVVINAAPATPNVVVTSPNIVCGATTTNLTAAAVTAGSDAGLTYSYFSNSAGTAVVNTPSAVTAGTYYIKGSNGNCTSALKSVVINAAPATPNVIVTAPTIACGATTANLTADAVTAESDAGLTYSYFSNSAGTAVVNTPSAVSARTYYIKGSNGNCTSALKDRKSVV